MFFVYDDKELQCLTSTEKTALKRCGPAMDYAGFMGK